MPDQDPAAQGQPPDAENPNPEAATNGVEKRINQLVAEREGERARAAQAEDALLAMSRQVAELTATMSTRLAPPTPAEPELEIDPDEMRKITSVASKMFNGKLQSLEQMLVKTQQMVLGLHNRTETEALPVRLPPELQAKADKLVQGMNARGIPYNMPDAIKHVIGEAYIEAETKKAAGTVARQRMNGTHTLPFFSSAPPSTMVQTPKADLPSNFDQLPPKERIKALKARGVEDQPL